LAAASRLAFERSYLKQHSKVFWFFFQKRTASSAYLMVSTDTQSEISTKAAP
jgi:hypothetical protein